MNIQADDNRTIWRLIKKFQRLPNIRQGNEWHFWNAVSTFSTLAARARNMPSVEKGVRIARIDKKEKPLVRPAPFEYRVHRPPICAAGRHRLERPSESGQPITAFFPCGPTTNPIPKNPFLPSSSSRWPRSPYLRVPHPPVPFALVQKCSAQLTTCQR